MTLELGRMSTWRLPVFSALLMALSASLRTDVLTMSAVLVDSQGAMSAARGICSVNCTLASRSHVERKECPSGARGAVMGSSAHVESGRSSITAVADSECWPRLPEGHLSRVAHIPQLVMANW